MSEYPDYFPDLWDEIGTVNRWHTARKQHQASVGSLSAPDPRTGKTGLQRLREIAEVGPSMAPFAVSLAKSGADLQATNLPAYVFQQQELMRNAKFGMPRFGSTVRPGAGLANTAPKYRLRNALDAANTLGMIDKNGRLIEPDTSDQTDPKRWLFEDLRGAFMGAGVDMPYVDTQGQDRNLSWSNSPTYPGGTNAQQLFRQHEAQGETANVLAANHFMPIAEQVAGKEGWDEILNQAQSLGLVDEAGYLNSPFGDVIRSEDKHEDVRVDSTVEDSGFVQNDARKRFWDYIVDQAGRDNVSLSAITPSGPATLNPGDKLFRTIPELTQTLTPDQLRDINKAENPGGLGGAIQDVTTAQAGLMNANTLATSSTVGDRFVGTPFRKGVQLSNIALNAGLQEGTGKIRNVYQAFREGNFSAPDWFESQSDLGIAIGQGDFSSFGDGFMVDPDSEIAKERVRREAERGQIDGHNMTLGRMTASWTPLDADTLPYNIMSGMIDFGAAIYLDPSTYVLKGIGHAGRMSNTVTGVADARAAAGAVDNGLFKYVIGQSTDAALDGKWGQGVTEKLAATPDAVEIARRTNWQWDPDTYTAVADATTPEAVREILRPKMQSEIRNLKDVYQGGFRSASPRLHTARETPIMSRLGAEVPENRWSKADPVDTARNMDNYGKIVRMPLETRNKFVDYAIRAENGEELETAVAGFFTEFDGILAQRGVTAPSLRNGLVTRYRADRSVMKGWFDDEIASATPVWDHALIDDDVLNAGTAIEGGKSPHVIAAELADVFEVPDIQNMARLTSNPIMRLFTTKNAIFGNKDLMEGQRNFPTLLLSYVQNQLWKPVTLARFAWTLRVIGEEQLRMAATHGIDSMFYHPMSYLAIQMGKKFDTDILSRPLDMADQFRQAMMQKRGGLLDDVPGRVRSNLRRQVYSKYDGDIGYRNSLADEIARHAEDPISRMIVNSNTLDEVVAWLNGDGALYRDRLEFVTGVKLKDRPEIITAMLAKQQKRISTITGGNNDLLKAISTKELNGEKMLLGNGMSNRKYREQIDNYLPSGPDSILGDITDINGYGDSALMRIEEGWNKTIDFMFSNLMSKPTNHLSRSPYFRQEYWRRMGELAPLSEDRAALRTHFQESASAMEAQTGAGGFINRRLHRKVEFDLNSPTTRNTEDLLSVEEMDVIAKDFALRATQRKLFDLSSKKHWEQAMSLVSPFVSAWKEVFTSWGRIVKEDPSVIRRGFQGVDVMNRSGFFYKDETTGEMIFTYPGSQFVSQKLLGVPIPLTGQAKGLSFMSQIIPGIGPVAQVPVTFLMQDKPEARWLYDMLVPFGSPAEGGLGSALNPLEYAPPWMKRLGMAASMKYTGESFLGDDDARIYGNSVLQIARYKASTGEFDVNNAAEMSRMMDESREAAARFYLIRSAASLGLPTAPSPRWLSNTKSGDLIPIAVLTEEYQRMLRGDVPGITYENADEEMLSKYGDEIVLSLTPFSRTLSWGLDPSSEFHDWVQENPDLKDKYQTTYGLYGPRGKFDIGVFSDQFMGEPERDSLSPEQWENFSQHMIASRLMEKKRIELGEEADTGEGSHFLSEYSDWLMQEYPGYNNFAGQAQTPEFDTAMAELRNAMEDPALDDNPVMKTVKQYMEQRDMVEADLEADEIYSFRGESDGATYARDYLTEYAGFLIEKNEDFRRFWDIFLRRELEENK